MLALVLVWPILGPDFPPGVDTPTFLHLSWVTKMAASGKLANPFQDPYWYGGFPYLIAYPPLGYGLVGISSIITGVHFITVYKVVLVIAYGGIATASYWLAREMGLRWWSAALAGVLTALAYPVMAALFLWGWFTSVLALPLALAAYTLLEKAIRTQKPRLAVLAGVIMSLAALVHHMTAFSLAVGLVGWFVYCLIFKRYERNQLVPLFGLFAGVAALVIAPWGIPFLVHLFDVGFRRDVPGIWLTDIGTFSSHIVNSGLIGTYVYPVYLGMVLTALAIAGSVHALMERGRLGGVVLMLLVVTWFGMGADLNPLIRVYPFSGLDTSRFQLYMVPFMALLAAAFVERVVQFISEWWPGLAPPFWRVVVVGVIALVLVLPVKEAWQARRSMQPYRVAAPVQQALDWLTTRSLLEDGGMGRVYSIGFWNWDTFLLPYVANRSLAHGWRDEAASNLRIVKELRQMARTGEVDGQDVHRLLRKMDVRYVLVYVAFSPGEAAEVFMDELEDHPQLFLKREQWGDLAAFQVLKPLSDMEGLPFS